MDGDLFAVELLMLQFSVIISHYKEYLYIYLPAYL